MSKITRLSGSWKQKHKEFALLGEEGLSINLQLHTADYGDVLVVVLCNLTARE